jgi:hypothetical protein
LSIAIRGFYDWIDTTKIAKQISTHAAVNILTLPATEFEFLEQAFIASMLFKPFWDKQNARGVCACSDKVVPQIRDPAIKGIEAKEH